MNFLYVRRALEWFLCIYEYILTFLWETEEWKFRMQRDWKIELTFAFTFFSLMPFWSYSCNLSAYLVKKMKDLEVIGGSWFLPSWGCRWSRMNSSPHHLVEMLNRNFQSSLLGNVRAAVPDLWPWWPSGPSGFWIKEGVGETEIGKLEYGSRWEAFKIWNL